MLVRGAEPMEKRQRRILFSALFVMAYAFALLRVQVTPAAAERQERPRLSERGGVISSELPFSALRPQLHFPLSHEALS